MTRRLNSTIKLQENDSFGNFNVLDEVTIDVTDLFLKDAETIKEAVLNFERDSNPYISSIPSVEAEVLDAAFGGPSEASLDIRKFLIEDLKIMGDASTEQYADGVDWITDDLLSKVRETLGLTESIPARGEAHVVSFASQWHVCRFNGKSWEHEACFGDEAKAVALAEKAVYAPSL